MPVRQGKQSPYVTAAPKNPHHPNSKFTTGSNTKQPSPATVRRRATVNSQKLLIDNTGLWYIPIRFQQPPRCDGITLWCRPQVLWQCRAVISVIYTDITAILSILPSNLHALIRRTPIYINHSYAYGLVQQPTVVHHTTAHHHPEWLLWAQDRPDKALSIEIYNATDFLRMRQHWNGCGLLLHEYCHVIHQQVLGLDNVRVTDLYRHAVQLHNYQRTLRRDWTGLPVDTDLHYGMVDAKEFFAEMSVTYWSRGYADLPLHVPTTSTASNSNNDPNPQLRMEDCSPPLIEPKVRQRWMQVLQQQQQGDNENSGTTAAAGHRLLEPVQPSKDDKTVPHCNKFYPFTAHQFRHHDPELYTRWEALWTSIASWKDNNIAQNGDEQDDDEAKSCCGWTPWPWWRMRKPAKLVVPTPNTDGISDTVSL